MKNKIIIGITISIFVLLMLPCISATQYKEIQSAQINFIEKIKTQQSTGICYSVLLDVLLLIYGCTVLSSFKVFSGKPIAFGIFRTVAKVSIINSIYVLAKLASQSVGETYEGEAPWCSGDGWQKLTQEEKTMYIALLLVNMFFLYPIRLLIVNTIFTK